MKNDKKERILCFAIIILIAIQVVLAVFAFAFAVNFSVYVAHTAVYALITLSALILLCHEIMFILCIYLCVKYPQNRFGQAMIIVKVLIYMLLFMIYVNIGLHTATRCDEYHDRWSDRCCKSFCSYW